MREIRLPEHLDLGEAYGRVDWSVRAIWETYAGWFHQHSTLDLYGARPEQGAAEIVDARGRRRRRRATRAAALVPHRSAHGGPAVRARARGRRRAPRRARRVPRARTSSCSPSTAARTSGSRAGSKARCAARRTGSNGSTRRDRRRSASTTCASRASTRAQRAALDYVATLDIRLRRRRDARAARATARGATTSATPASAPRLDAMIAAVEADTGLGPLGRLADPPAHDPAAHRAGCSSRTSCAGAPRSSTIELAAPIIVIGLPRSGTTHLVNLIAADTRLRSLPYWESLEPCPLPGDGPTATASTRASPAAGATTRRRCRWCRCCARCTTSTRPRSRRRSSSQDLDFASYTLEWLARVPELARLLPRRSTSARTTRT